MARLAQEGFVLLGGPLAGSEQGRLRVLLIVDATDEAEIHRRLASDPWTLSGHLEVACVEIWALLIGQERIASS
jgi:uncharacterized protein YciI